MLSTLLFAFATAQALVPNGTFEEVLDGRPAGWRTQTWGGRATHSLSSEGRGGSRAVLIDSSEGADAAWYVTARVKPYSKYRLQAYIRTENVAPVNRGPGALINLHGRSERTEAVAGTKDWTEVEMTFDTGADDALQINCLLGYYGTAKGKAWFDDVTLQLLETRELKPQATINAEKTFEPIPKYIYSQFIEHLGQCIYGGIWAEMLEDRKFFYPLEGKTPFETAREGYRRLVASPWIRANAAEAKLERTDFRDQPTLRLKGEVAQSGLELVAGRDYVVSITYRGGPVSTTLRTPNRELGLRPHPKSERWKTTSYRIRAGEGSKEAQFAVLADNSSEIAAVSVMPADNLDGFRRDTIELLRELNAPLYRWPGGNFVSGYDWRDGIGDRNRRPTRRNPAWSGIEPNDVGTHEFIRFCELVGAEPLIVVNTGFGDAHSAAAWVQYVNGPARTEEGARRAKNGRREPWKVEWWGIGNEMYGPWQLGHMALDQYITKHNLVFDRMTQVDPTIKTIASSDLGGGWSERMLRDSGDRMTLISEHFYCQEKESVIAHVAQIPNAIRGKVEAHRRFRETMPGLKRKDIRIAMDEWNYWYGPHVYGELGTRYFVKDGLGIAAGLHEYFRSTDIVGMAQYAQTVNVIGCIKTTPTAAAFETTGLVLKLYRKEFGTIPVAVEGAPEPLDVSAALTADRKTITLSIVNPTGETMSLPIMWKGASPSGAYSGWTIAHDDPMAYNTPGEPPKVRIEEVAPERLPGGIQVRPYSVNLLRFPIP